MSDHEIEKSSSNSVTSEEVPGPIRPLPDDQTQHLDYPCEITREVKDGHFGKRHEETTYLRATSPSSSSGLVSDNSIMLENTGGNNVHEVSQSIEKETAGYHWHILQLPVFVLEVFIMIKTFIFAKKHSFFILLLVFPTSKNFVPKKPNT